ncbi:MAG: hypothetical protein ACM37W_06310 [Actinomycetota bacterium]
MLTLQRLFARSLVKIDLAKVGTFQAIALGCNQVGCSGPPDFDRAWLVLMDNCDRRKRPKHRQEAVTLAIVK